MEPYISTTISDIDMLEDPAPDAPAYIYVMIGSGIIGMILIAAFSIHSMRHFIKDDITSSFACLYILYFFFSWLLCFSYALLKSNLVFPMGTSVDCRIGVYFIAYSLSFSQVFLFLIFMYRIDTAFHSSALAYPRKYLIAITISYVILVFCANIGYVYTTYFHLKLITAQYFGNESDGICTFSAYINHSAMILILGIGSLANIAYSLLICSLFVYKLNKVIKMSESVSQHQNEKSADNRLQKVMKKQTILVLLACISSIFFIGIYGLVPSMTLLIPIDTIVNAFCVWLMFSFADPIWNKIVRFCCCCCFCFYRQDLLITLHSIPKRLFRDRHSISISTENNQTTNKNTMDANDRNIEIDFKNANNITLQLDNRKKDKSATDNDIGLQSQTKTVPTIKHAKSASLPVESMTKEDSDVIGSIMQLTSVESTRL